jgi:flagellar export protein FliJ
VSKTTRLETVYKLRETEEDRARALLANAQRNVAHLSSQLQVAKNRAMADERKGASAAQWSIIESAHVRALHEARQAEHEVNTAKNSLSKSREIYIGAHIKTEALRRVIENRRIEAAQAEEKADRKTMDEVAMLLYMSPA